MNWRREGNALPTKARLDRNRLLLTNVHSYDTGRYICQRIDSNGQETASYYEVRLKRENQRHQKLKSVTTQTPFYHFYWKNTAANTDFHLNCQIQKTQSENQQLIPDIHFLLYKFCEIPLSNLYFNEFIYSQLLFNVHTIVIL